MADIQIEDITPSALDGTDKILVRRGAGPLDHTMELVDPAEVGQAPGGSANELQINDGAGGFLGLADVEGEDGQLRLPHIATPATPAAGGLKLFGMDAITGALAYMEPDGRVRMVQPSLAEWSVNRFQPSIGLNSFVGEQSLNLVTIGTATAAVIAVARLHTMLPRVDNLVTVPAATAIAGWRGNGTNARHLRVGRDANAPGGFVYGVMWGPATGVATATQRGFCGLYTTASAPTDVEPSSRPDIIGMGWDAADTNIQIMHNDASGAATKIDLGSDFPVPTVDREQVYELQLYSPNSLTQSVNYRVIRYATDGKTIAAEATGTITTNLPSVTTLLTSLGCVSAGGTSSVQGMALMGIYAGTEY